MIYLVNERFSGSIVGYLESGWAREMGSRIRILPYQKLYEPSDIPSATTLFTDHEMVTESQARLVGELWDALTAAGAPCYNNPHRVLNRPRLLEDLYRAGVNTFRAVRADDALDDLRFPVFVRQLNEHTGALTRLLRNRKQLDWSIRMLTRFAGHSRRSLLVVEFCDTKLPSGLYAKYSAFRVGDRIIPRCLEFGKHWVVKHHALVLDEELARVELDYVEANPHESELRTIFDRAGIDFGRVDYALLEDRIQVWEINTNPRPGQRPFSHGGIRSQDGFDWPLRKTAKTMFFTAYREALAELDRPVSAGSVAWTVDPGLVRRICSEESALRRRHGFQNSVSRLRRSRVLARGARWLADRV